MRTCIKCGIEKSLDEYSKMLSGKGGRRATCKICRCIETTPQTKKCGSCNRVKTFYHFHNMPENPDGKHTKCRLCVGILPVEPQRKQKVKPHTLKCKEWREEDKAKREAEKAKSAIIEKVHMNWRINLPLEEVCPT